MSYRILALTGALACFATSVDATVIRPIEFSDLVVRAQAIVYGRVVELRPRYNDDRTKIETIVTVEVGSYLKGDLGKEVAFVIPGGTMGRYRAMAVGAPQFAEGEEIVVFLTARAPAIPHVLGQTQGVFRVAVDSRTGERTIARVPRPGFGPRQPIGRGSAANPPISLSAFSGLVQTVMENGQ